jgi:hypothetical protein
MASSSACCHLSIVPSLTVIENRRVSWVTQIYAAPPDHLAHSRVRPIDDPLPQLGHLLRGQRGCPARHRTRH